MGISRGALVPIREQVESDILDGEIVFVEDIATLVEEISETTNPHRSAYGLLTNIRRRLAVQGLPLVPTSNGGYGIPKSKGDVEYAMQRYAGYAHNLMNNAYVLKNYANQKNLLPASFQEQTIKLPKFTK